MMTSRSEYRLLLRQDNADARLTEIGSEIGLVSSERYKRFVKKRDNVENEILRLNSKIIPPLPKVCDLLEERGTTAIKSGTSAVEILRRPQIAYDDLSELDAGNAMLTRQEREQVEVAVKYEGYIAKQIRQVEQFKKLENKTLPEDLPYADIAGLRIEAKMKLAKIKPVSLGQASRISGVSPSDIAVLMIYLEKRKRTDLNYAKRN
ncbi:MAG: tRNA uridine 5-carboxymethylaminomethyl modification enzyme MnmG [candidate division WS2 bacterium]|nr:tRNA uridine 5-carboxymethylaminomethyl modification enzyme MnmG [Candidatus Psychracetigena formicireducens]